MAKTYEELKRLFKEKHNDDPRSVLASINDAIDRATKEVDGIAEGETFSTEKGLKAVVTLSMAIQSRAWCAIMISLKITKDSALAFDIFKNAKKVVNVATEVITNSATLTTQIHDPTMPILTKFGVDALEHTIAHDMLRLLETDNQLCKLMNAAILIMEKN